MRAVLLALALVPSALRAQSPVADAIRHALVESRRNLVGAAEAMPESAYGYRPTPAQMSFGAIVRHVAESNRWSCGIIGGRTVPEVAHDSSADKAHLVASLRASFALCDSVLSSLTDAHLREVVWTFPNDPMTRARAIIGLAGDWEDHYAAMAIYLRLNGVLPPTASQ
jgi:hypothetical protein